MAGLMGAAGHSSVVCLSFCLNEFFCLLGSWLVHQCTLGVPVITPSPQTHLKLLLTPQQPVGFEQATSLSAL
jgi:hypothetical protein